MAIDIKDTKGDVIGAGVSGSGNIIGKELNLSVTGQEVHVHIDGKSEQAAQLLQRIKDDSSSIYQINSDTKINNKNPDEVQHVKTLASNTSDIWEFVKKTEIESGQQIEKIKAGDTLISRNELLVKNTIIQGLLYFFSGDIQNSNQCFDRAIEMDPNNALAWYDKGNVLAFMGNPQGAIQCFDRVLQIDPNYVMAWNDKGLLLTNLGNVNGAMYCFDRAIQIDPSVTIPWYNKGILLAMLRDPQGAIQCFDKAIETSSTFAPAWYNKAVVLNSLGRFTEAMQCLNRARMLGLPV